MEVFIQILDCAKRTSLGNRHSATVGEWWSVNPELFPKCVPLSLSLTVWACSPHKLLKGNFLISYPFAIIPYSDFSILPNWILPLMGSGSRSALCVVHPWGQVHPVSKPLTYLQGSAGIPVCGVITSCGSTVTRIASKELFCVRRLPLYIFSFFEASTKSPKGKGRRALP